MPTSIPLAQLRPLGDAWHIAGLPDDLGRPIFDALDRIESVRSQHAALTEGNPVAAATAMVVDGATLADGITFAAAAADRALVQRITRNATRAIEGRALAAMRATGDALATTIENRYTYLWDEMRPHARELGDAANAAEALRSGRKTTAAWHAIDDVRLTVHALDRVREVLADYDLAGDDWPPASRTGRDPGPVPHIAARLLGPPPARRGNQPTTSAPTAPEGANQADADHASTDEPPAAA